MFHHYPHLRSALRSWAAGMAVATPIVAVLQGTLLLQDYRTHHGHAPRPNVPSSGIVIANSSIQFEADKGECSSDEMLLSTSAWRVTKHSPSAPLQDSIEDDNPLRLLVIGDSLAAGVGTSRSSTPVLPAAIAEALSEYLQGRAVTWTCIGTPGLNSAELVKQIHGLTSNKSAMTRRFNSVTSSFRESLQRWHEANKKALERLSLNDDLAEETQAQDNVDPINGQRNAIVQWWDARMKHLQWEAKKWQQVIMEHNERQQQQQQQEQQKQQKVIKVDPSQFDVAIVLTGLNDLKESFLPFMVSAQRAKMLQDLKDDGGQGLKAQLIRVVHALQEKMKRHSGNTQDDVEQQLLHDENHHHSPIVVFPALPFEPIELSQRAPLCWFLVPLIQMMDQNKQLLAEMYPELVLFVEAPNAHVFSQAEAKRGPLWKEQLDVRNQGNSNASFHWTDIAHNARDKLQDLMNKHYRNWAEDAVEDAKENDPDRDTVYQVDSMGVTTIPAEEMSSRHPGATMVAMDGVHPNDAGYDMWGRLIAQAIVVEWRKKIVR